MISSNKDEQSAHIEQTTLALEEIDLNLYRSKNLWKPIGARGVFGGQIIGLALAAANKTVSSQFHVHSLHSYFLLPGDNAVPIVFLVSRIRDGKSFCTRSVQATQRGKVIFAMMSSYKIPEIGILHHQLPMPDVPPPESCTSEEDRLRGWLKDPRAAPFHNLIKMRLEQPFPVEFRHIGFGKRPGCADKPNAEIEPVQMLWCKAKEKLGDEVNLHHCVLAYLTDHELLNTALIPHGLNRLQDKRNAMKSQDKPRITMMTSLDHTMWFHAPYRADDWLLYVMDSPKSGDGRGFSRGDVFTRDGKLVLSVSQEGVIRFTVPEPIVDSSIATQTAKL